jgi:hypothetical protein
MAAFEGCTPIHSPYMWHGACLQGIRGNEHVFRDFHETIPSRTASVSKTQ